jgi:hypothetical protein
LISPHEVAQISTITLSLPAVIVDI